MRIGIFGGSFDPIHAGHVALARYALEHASLDEVWLMVSPRNPLKQSGPVASDADRLEMARLAVAGCKGVRVSDFEFSLPVPSYTWLTLEKLRDAYPGDSFSLIIGGDNWADFDRWKNPDKILEEFGVMVYPRPGEKLDKGRRGVTILEDAPQMRVSSTEIRNLLHSADLSGSARLAEILHPDVLAYIRSHRIYFGGSLAGGAYDAGE